MRENGSDVKASRAFDVHEKAIRALNQPLQLMLGLFLGRRRMKKISGHGLQTERTELKGLVIDSDCTDRRCLRFLLDWRGAAGLEAGGRSGREVLLQERTDPRHSFSR